MAPPLRVHLPDVFEDLLAVTVVLVEPGHDLGRTHQVDGAERPPQRRLKHIQSHVSTREDLR